jgi:hypothetical protein
VGAVFSTMFLLFDGHDAGKGSSMDEQRQIKATRIKKVLDTYLNE